MKINKKSTYIKSEIEIEISKRLKNLSNEEQSSIQENDLLDFGLIELKMFNLDREWRAFCGPCDVRLYMNKKTKEIHLSNDDSEKLGNVYSIEQFSSIMVKIDRFWPEDLYYEGDKLKIHNH